ncbi:reverse transcriptase domain-containing protein [Tanacetum coccineum]
MDSRAKMKGLESTPILLTEETYLNSLMLLYSAINRGCFHTLGHYLQRFDESFYKAWDHFKDLLRACPHHGFTELRQLDTFYNALTPTDQYSLNAAAGVSTNAPSSTPHFPDIAAVADAVKAMLAQKSSPPSFVKAVEEICVTCGAAEVNYNQGNIGYRPQSLANQIRPSGFAQPNVQNNQTRYNQGYNQNRGNNQGNPSYQAPIQQTQVAPSNKLSNYKKIIDTNIKAMKNQINNVKNEIRNEMKTSMSNQTNELKNMMASFFQMNIASSSGSGSLPSNTVANPRGDLKEITTRSGISYYGPPIPPLPKVVEQEPEPVVAPKPKPSIPYPSRANKQKLREEVDKLASKFVEFFRELHFELTKTPVNENCSAVILKKLPKKLGDPDKFLIPCDFPELVECLALDDLGESINLMSLSICKKLSLPELNPTQMILELANRSTTSPSGIAEDVFVKVGKFHFPVDDPPF